jgi:hypothetical protein
MPQYVHQNKKFNQVYYYMMTKNFNFWNGSPMVKTWFLKLKVTNSSLYTYNIGYLGYFNFK